MCATCSDVRLVSNESESIVRTKKADCSPREQRTEDDTPHTCRALVPVCAVLHVARWAYRCASARATRLRVCSGLTSLPDCERQSPCTTLDQHRLVPLPPTYVRSGSKWIPGLRCLTAAKRPSPSALWDQDLSQKKKTDRSSTSSDPGETSHLTVAETHLSVK